MPYIILNHRQEKSHSVIITHIMHLHETLQFASFGGKEFPNFGSFLATAKQKEVSGKSISSGKEKKRRRRTGGGRSREGYEDIMVDLGNTYTHARTHTYIHPLPNTLTYEAVQEHKSNSQ